MDTERSATIVIGGQSYELILTTRATKEIARRYGGLENLGEKLMKSENFEMALDEVVWLLTLLVIRGVESASFLNAIVMVCKVASIGIFILFYFLLIRPQQKRAKEHATAIGAVKRGDTVVLGSGMIGKVTRVEEAEVNVEIAPSVNVRVVKSMIAEVRNRTAIAANDSKA